MNGLVNRGLLAALLAGLVVASVTPAGAFGPIQDADGDERTWLAGDWHVHTHASHDACNVQNATGFAEDLEEGCGDGPHTLSASGSTRMLQAQARGLDYLRITDHNNLGGPHDAAENYEGPVTLVPGYEHSLPGGHAGISTLDLLAQGVFPTPEDASGLGALIEDVQAEPGGLFVANHPFDGGPSVWTEESFDLGQVDAVEIWNIHWLWRDDVLMGTLGASNNDQSLELWTQALNQGHELPIVGGSDNHWLATTAAQGPGQPTTWVKAASDEPAAIIDAVREGRTYVTWDFAGPRLTFTGSGPAGETAIPGDRLPTGEELDFEVEVTAGAGERIRFVSCQGVEAETPALPQAEVTLSYEEDCWVRVDLVDVDDAGGAVPDKLVYRAITSPIYVG